MNYSLAHGHWKVYLHNRTLITHTAGAWNVSAMEMFCREVKEQASPLILDDKPWASLVLLEDYELGVPEIEPLLQDLLEYLVKRGLRYEAAVFNGGFARAEQMERNLPQDPLKYTRQNFSNVESAGEWLQQHGFELNISAIHLDYERWRG